MTLSETLEIVRDPRRPPIAKYIALRQLQRDDERAFYSLLVERTEELLPYVYTPTVGEACQNYHRLPIEAVGLYLTPDDVPNDGVLRKLARYLARRRKFGTGGGGGGDDGGGGDLLDPPSLAALPPVDVAVVTDSSRILGLGDCGAGGMGISEGKILLYTAVGGVDERGCLPICLDTGTDNQRLLSDPKYRGVRKPRASPEVLDGLVGELVRALQRLLELRRAPSPSSRHRTTLLHFEDFSSASAFRLLGAFEECGLPSFNDDVQGTASVGLAALLAALRLGESSCRSSPSTSSSSSSSSSSHHRRPLSPALEDQLVLFYGAGEAGVGIGELVAAAIEKRSRDPLMSREKARKRCVFIDSRGLVTAERAAVRDGGAALAHHKLPFAHAGLPRLEGRGEDLLLAAVRVLRPTALVGVSAVKNAFSARVLDAMAEANDRPIVMPLSNPTSLAECTFAEAVDATEGRVVFASGSPFDPIEVSSSPSSRRSCSQANNAYVFPAVGSAALLTGATRLREGAFLAAAESLAAQATADDASKGLLFPPFSRASDVSAAVAAAVAEEIVSSGDGTAPDALEFFERGAARAAGVAGWEAAVRSRMVNLTMSRL